MSAPQFPAAGRAGEAHRRSSANSAQKGAAQAASLTASQKAAIVIGALGAEAAAGVLEKFNNADLRAFAQAMSSLRQVSAPAVTAAITDFIKAVAKSEGLKLGSDAAREMLANLMEPDQVSQMIEDVEGPSGRTLWEKLSNSSEEALAAFLSREHPQTTAVLLTRLQPEKGARLLERLEPDLAKAVLLRLSRAPQIGSAVLEQVKMVLQNEFLAATGRNQTVRAPEDMIGSMMNYLPMSASDAFLKHLEAEDADLAQGVRKVMFTFNDIVDRVEPRNVQLVLKAVENDVLLKALKMAKEHSPKVVEFLLKNISKRVAEQIEEDLELAPAVKTRDGEQAQSQVVSEIQKLVASGEIQLIEQEQPAE